MRSAGVLLTIVVGAVGCASPGTSPEPAPGRSPSEASVPAPSLPPGPPPAPAIPVDALLPSEELERAAGVLNRAPTLARAPFDLVLSGNGEDDFEAKDRERKLEVWFSAEAGKLEPLAERWFRTSIRLGPGTYSFEDHAWIIRPISMVQHHDWDREVDIYRLLVQSPPFPEDERDWSDPGALAVASGPYWGPRCEGSRTHGCEQMFKIEMGEEAARQSKACFRDFFPWGDENKDGSERYAEVAVRFTGGVEQPWGRGATDAVVEIGAFRLCTSEKRSKEGRCGGWRMDGAGADERLDCGLK